MTSTYKDDTGRQVIRDWCADRLAAASVVDDQWDVPTRAWPDPDRVITHRTRRPTICRGAGWVLRCECARSSSDVSTWTDPVQWNIPESRVLGPWPPTQFGRRVRVSPRLPPGRVARQPHSHAAGVLLRILGGQQCVQRHRPHHPADRARKRRLPVLPASRRCQSCRRPVPRSSRPPVVARRPRMVRSSPFRLRLHLRRWDRRLYRRVSPRPDLEAWDIELGHEIMAHNDAFNPLPPSTR